MAPDIMFVSDTSIGQMSDGDAPDEMQQSRSQYNLSKPYHLPSTGNTTNAGDCDAPVGLTSDSDVQSATTSGCPDDDSRNTTPVALYTFLIERAGRNPHLANYLYWYLSTECDSNDEAVRKPDVRVQRMYERMLKLLKRSLAIGMWHFYIIICSM